MDYGCHNLCHIYCYIILLCIWQDSHLIILADYVVK